MKSKPFLLACLLFSSAAFGQTQDTARFHIRIPKIFDFYEIGVTNADDLIKSYQGFNKEYNQGQVPYRNWKDRKAPFPWNYHAELIRDVQANLSTDSLRSFQAKFVPGYRIIIEDGIEGWGFMPLKNIEMVFDNNQLISFTGDGKPNFYKGMIYSNGAPRIIEKKDTVGVGAGKVILKKTQYIWRKGDVKAEVTVTQHLNIYHKIYTTNVFTMTDSVRNAIYLKKIAQQKEVLAREYAARSKGS